LFKIIKNSLDLSGSYMNDIIDKQVMTKIISHIYAGEELAVTIAELIKSMVDKDNT
jgi:hypothetical protein